jgi:hypothetical protein
MLCEGKKMKKTTLQEVRNLPSRKFSIQELPPKRFDMPQYMVCEFSQQFPTLTDQNSVLVVEMKTGKVSLMSASKGIWLFNSV